MEYREIIEFWFEEIDASRWWRQSDEFDRRLAERYGALHRQALQCELFGWRIAPLGRLAEIIVLDQFSRHIHRGKAQAFAADPLALALAQEAIVARADAVLAPHQRSFLYMPFMHSESRAIHAIAVELFREAGLESNLAFERRHKAIIDRFGRYPHRNAALGRTSSDEEIAFLATPGSSF